MWQIIPLKGSLARLCGPQNSPRWWSPVLIQIPAHTMLYFSYLVYYEDFKQIYQQIWGAVVNLQKSILLILCSKLSAIICYSQSRWRLKQIDQQLLEDLHGEEFITNLRRSIQSYYSLLLLILCSKVSASQSRWLANWLAGIFQVNLCKIAVRLLLLILSSKLSASQSQGDQQIL